MVEANRKLNSPISLSEYRSAKDKMHKNRAVGLDGIPAECILGRWDDSENALVSPVDGLVLHLFNTVIMNGRYPDVCVALL